MSASSFDNKKTDTQNTASSGTRATDSLDTRQRFIKNNQYFTICIYALVMVLLSAIIFKCIIDFDKTKSMISYVFFMLSPFLLGALLAYMLNPMVHLFYRYIDKLNRRFDISMKHTTHTVLSILITYLIVIGFLVLVLVFVIPEITRNLIDFVNYLPTIYDKVIEFLGKMQERFPSLNIDAIRQPITDAMPNIVSSIQNLATSIMPAIYSLSVSIAEWLINFLITVIVSVYMLYDKRRIMRSSWKLIYAFFPRKHIPALKELLAEGNRIFSSFVVGKFIDSLIIGLLCFVIMSILRLPYTLLISMIVGVTNMIPYFGPFIGAVPGVLIILFIKPIQALIFAIMILCLQQFDGLILGPKILGNSTGMKPLWIIFAITIGGKFAGVIGMFLGVPVVAFLSYMAEIYLEHRLRKKHVTASDVENVLNKMELDD